MTQKEFSKSPVASVISSPGSPEKVTTAISVPLAETGSEYFVAPVNAISKLFDEFALLASMG